MAVSDFKSITKIRLSISVVFSSIAGYFLGAEAYSDQTFNITRFLGILW